MPGSKDIHLTRWQAGEWTDARDHAATEEPLQLIVDGHPLAVLMRTPGNDDELAVGFLLTEGVISTAQDIKRIDTTDRPNHVLVFLADGVALDHARLTRHLFSASSCGLCGKATIEAITAHHPPVAAGPSFSLEVILRTPDALRQAQDTFTRTGGLHASALCDGKGQLLVVREDIGRHNALDKALGRALLDGVDLSGCFLMLSGRVSFELMQKALAGRLPLVAAISAPSSLAIEFAEKSNQTLLAFLRPPTVNLYCHGQRVRGI